MIQHEDESHAEKRGAHLHVFIMIYCFDTSALNCLHDDPECANMTVGLTATNTVWITALNVIEAGITNETVRRISLLKLQKQLGRDIRPLQIPNLLLQECASAFAARQSRKDLSIGKDQNGIWYALSNPEQIDEAARQKLYAWKKELEDNFRTAHERGRPQFQKLFESMERPRNVATLLRHYMQRTDFLYEVTAEIYEIGTRVKLQRDEFSSFFDSAPQWPFFFLGWAYAIYARAIQPANYGRSNAGTIDIWCATYLPSCNVFVTADAAQYKALRLINTFNQRPCRILRYSTLRRSLLIG